MEVIAVWVYNWETAITVCFISQALICAILGALIIRSFWLLRGIIKRNPNVEVNQKQIVLNIISVVGLVIVSAN